MAQGRRCKSKIVAIFLLFCGVAGCLTPTSPGTSQVSQRSADVSLIPKPGTKAVPDPITGVLTCPKEMALFGNWCVPCMPYETPISTTTCREIVLGAGTYIDPNHPHGVSVCPQGTTSPGGRASMLVGKNACKAVDSTITSNQDPVPKTCVQKAADIGFPESRIRGWLTSYATCGMNWYAHSFENTSNLCYVRTKNQYNSYNIKCQKWFEGENAFVQFDPWSVPERLRCMGEGLDQIASEDLVWVKFTFFNIGNRDYIDCPAVQFHISSGSRLKCCNYENPSSKPKESGAGCITKDFHIEFIPGNWGGRNPLQRIVTCGNAAPGFQWPYPYQSSSRLSVPYVYCHQSGSNASWAKMGWWSNEYAGFVIDCSHWGGFSEVTGRIFCCKEGMQPTQNYEPGAVRKTIRPD